MSLVVSTFFTAGIMNFSLKVARGAPYAFGDLFSGAPFFLSVLAANFIIGLAISLGFVFLIVPGVILALGLSMTHAAHRRSQVSDRSRRSRELAAHRREQGPTSSSSGSSRFGLTIAGAVRVRRRASHRWSIPLTAIIASWHRIGRMTSS